MEILVSIKKKNNVFATLHCDDRGFLMSIYEHFSRYVKGYMFTPAYKTGGWSGKIRFFNLMTGEIYLGIVNKVIDYCKSEGVSVSLDPQIIAAFSDNSVQESEVMKYLDELRPSNGKGEILEQRDYQKKAVNTIITRKRRKIASPTSSGKSLIIYAACRYLLDKKFKPDEKILIVVPTISLIKQMKSDFTEYSQINGWDSQNIVGEIGGGAHEGDSDNITVTFSDKSVLQFTGNDKINLSNGTKVLAKDLTKSAILNTKWLKKIGLPPVHIVKIKKSTPTVYVGTWQSLVKKDAEWLSQFRALFVDEAHEAATKSLIDIGKKCNAEYRLGMSGSFTSDDETTELTLCGLFGNTTTTITTKDMIDSGYAAKLHIKCIQLKHEEQVKKLDWQKEVEYIATHENRNNFIVDLADGLKGNTLILFQLVEKHGKPLFNLAKSRSGKKVFFIYGGTDVDDREEIRKILEKNSDCILIASYRTFATGTNVKNLEHIIFGSPTKSYTRVIQSIGRGLRLNAGKFICTLYDIFDFISGDKKDIKSCNYTFEYFGERLKIYTKEQHPYDIVSQVI